jgi:hypothetical protein
MRLSDTREDTEMNANDVKIMGRYISPADVVVTVEGVNASADLVFYTVTGGPVCFKGSLAEFAGMYREEVKASDILNNALNHILGLPRDADFFVSSRKLETADAATLHACDIINNRMLSVMGL